MRFDIVTLFPRLVEGYLTEGIISKAVGKEIISVHVHDLREYGEGSYRKIDDRPFGGGAGMVLMFEPMAKCLEEVAGKQRVAGVSNAKVVATTAKGVQYKQSTAKGWSDGATDALTVLCGRYEGFDQRILDELVDVEVSMGPYVLTGGELAALVIIDSVGRLLPGVLGKEESFEHDSFYDDDKTIQYPQYTRPEIVEFKGKVLRVPEELLSGHHAEIEKWRAAQKKQKKHCSV